MDANSQYDKQEGDAVPIAEANASRITNAVSQLDYVP
jgi:hypothetical protein